MRKTHSSYVYGKIRSIKSTTMEFYAGQRDAILVRSDLPNQMRLTNFWSRLVRKHYLRGAFSRIWRTAPLRQDPFQTLKNEVGKKPQRYGYRKKISNQNNSVQNHYNNNHRSIYRSRRRNQNTPYTYCSLPYLRKSVEPDKVGNNLKNSKV